MRETTQMDNERYRWIPNTGEYLELRDINVYIRNKTGVDVTNGNINIEFAGLNDRDYNIDTSGTNGNIYKNKAEKFMVKLYGNGQETGVAENSVTRNAEGFYEYTNSKEITINQQGVLMDGTNPLVVAVRPESAAKAYPGDDFILRFNLLDNSGNILKAINCDEKDYVAVYDKKMLWRANLYIDEGKVEDTDVSLDWNDIHPWNAPRLVCYMPANMSTRS